MSQQTTALSETQSTGRDYGYCNARVRGMRSHLLNQAFFEQLMDCRDMRGIIQELSNTEYGPDLEETILHGQTFTQVDEALKNNMVRMIRKVLGFVNGEAELLVTTLLGRWDLFNIKTIIRGKHMHLPADEILDSLIPMGQLRPIELRALTQAEDVRAVVDTLYTWELPYAVPLKEQMPKYVADNELAVLELALDRYYTGWAAGKLKGRRSNYKLARNILGVQTDSINLLSVFRLLKADVEGLDVKSFYLPGGTSIGERLFVELAGMSDIDEVLDRLRGTPYGKTLGEAAMRFLESNSVATLERTLEDYVVRKAISAWRGDPLGAGVIISYLWSKENEVTNLRIIVKGNSVGMPADRVRRELIIV